MKKGKGAIYYLLGILEAMVSGVFFSLARDDDEEQILNLLAGVVSFLCGFTHMTIGSRLFKEAGGAEAAEREDL